jgi:large subunit ribosomal protein L14
MIQPGTLLHVVDNSGVKYVKCIRVLAPSIKSSGNIGDVLIVSVKTIQQQKKIVSKIKQGDIFHAIVVNTLRMHQKFDSQRFQFFNNCVVLVNKNLKPVGNRIIGPVIKSLRQMQAFKFVSISAGLI